MGTPMRKPMGRQMNGPMKDGVEHVELAPGFTVSRVATGLWQIADMERAGEGLDAERTSAALGPYLDAGFTGFAVSDRHGSPADSERIIPVGRKPRF
jgi:hypothetical protein